MHAFNKDLIKHKGRVTHIRYILLLGQKADKHYSPNARKTVDREGTGWIINLLVCTH